MSDSELVERVKLELLKAEGHEEWEELASHWGETYTGMARAAIAEVQRWRSIAEAPKDEKPILAYWGPIQEGAARCMDIAVWHEGKLGRS